MTLNLRLVLGLNLMRLAYPRVEKAKKPITVKPFFRTGPKKDLCVCACMCMCVRCEVSPMAAEVCL